MGHEHFVLEGHRGSIWYLAFRPDGKALAAAGQDGSISLWAVPPR